MTKQKIVDVLKEKGYDARLEDNLPTVYIKKDSMSENQMRSLFQDQGYAGSFRYIIKNE